jgi:hypothetical protein
MRGLRLFADWSNNTVWKTRQVGCPFFGLMDFQ